MEKFSGQPRGNRTLITVQLSCGDQVTSRNPPLHGKTTYICPANRGHGYKVTWTKYTMANGFTRENPAAPETA